MWPHPWSSTSSTSGANPNVPHSRTIPTIGIPVLETSAQRDAGSRSCESSSPGKVTVLVGPSGVGKSSLLNALYPRLNLRTGSISRATSRGVHTTVRVEWIDLPCGGVVLDTPGLRAITPWGIDRSNLASAFPEFRRLEGRCRFPDCNHHREPDCVVRLAVVQGAIPAFRYDSYVRILEIMTGRPNRK